MNIGGVWAGLRSGMPAGNLLKSTREKMERRQECENKVAFYEDRIAALKTMGGASLEDISSKLEMFHAYQDYIAAAKHEYNNQQMFRAMDEARERGEKIAEAVEERRPKTAEERRREALEEATGTEGGLLTEIMEEMAEQIEEVKEQAMQAEDLKEQVEQAEDLEEQVEQAEDLEEQAGQAEDLEEQAGQAEDLEEQAGQMEERFKDNPAEVQEAIPGEEALYISPDL